MRLFRKLALLVPVAAAVVALAVLGRRVLGPGQPDRPPAGEPAGAEEVSVVAPGEAGAHLGERARVCGRVTEGRYLPRVRGRPTFLNFGGRHPDQLFTAVVWGRDREEFSFRPEEAYRGSLLCVRGTVQEHEGIPQIVVSDPAQVEVRRALPGEDGAGRLPEGERNPR